MTTVLPALPPGPMLATPGSPPSGPDWIVEAKWDGARALTRVHGNAIDMVSRPGNTLVSRFPEVLASLHTALDGHTVILDGEIVALGNHGRPDFGRLQRRLRVAQPNARLRTTVPARYLLFDILHLDGTDLTRWPYAQRREALEGLGLPRDGAVVVPPCWHGLDGRLLLAVTTDLALEGVVCKRAASTYQPGRRSRSWVKTVIRRKAPLVVAGWTGGRANPIGALLLGGHDTDGHLVYCGAVSSGLSRVANRAIHEQLQLIETRTSPLARLPGQPMFHARWVRPALVGMVEYREFPGRLRHPAWKGLITLNPADVKLPPHS